MICLVPFFLFDKPNSHEKVSPCFRKLLRACLEPPLEKSSQLTPCTSQRKRGIAHAGPGPHILLKTRSDRKPSRPRWPPRAHWTAPSRARNAAVLSPPCSLPQVTHQGTPANTRCQQPQLEGSFPVLNSPDSRLPNMQVLKQAQCYDYISGRRSQTNSIALQADVYSILAYQSLQIPVLLSKDCI